MNAHTLPGFEAHVGIIIPTEGAFRAASEGPTIGPSYIGARLPGFEPAAVGIIIPTEGEFRAKPGSGEVGPSYIGAVESPLMKWEQLRQYLHEVYVKAGLPTRYETEQAYLDTIRAMPEFHLRTIVETMTEVEKLGYLSDVQKRHLLLARQEVAYREQGGVPPKAQEVIYEESEEQYGPPPPPPKKKPSPALGLWLLGGLVVVGVGVAVFAGKKK